MSATYRITLIQLKADAAGVGAPNDKIDHGTHPVEEIVRLGGKLLQLDLSSTRAEPGVIVQRGDKGWRIGIHQGRLRMHKSMSLFDDFWTVDSAAGLADLPPFQMSSGAAAPRVVQTSSPRRHGTFRTLIEAAGLFAAAVVLVLVGLRFGLPQRRLSDLPPGVAIVTSSDERSQIFQSVAGYYSTDRKPGSDLVIISPDGRVSLGTIGRDGKPSKPRLEEQAKAGRQGDVACIVLSTGVVISAIAPPDEVKFGRFSWKKAPASVSAVN